jgi:hypothetical protein
MVPLNNGEWAEAKTLVIGAVKPIHSLDFPHAAEYLNTLGALTLGDGQSAPADWFTQTLHQPTDSKKVTRTHRLNQTLTSF